MRLKPIPKNTVVHTPTEEEAKELLDILNENGYLTTNGNPLTKHIAEIRYFFHDKICFDIDCTKHVCFHKRHFYKELGLSILTIAEFKERYCEEEKSPQKFDKGQKVRITNKKHPYYAHKGKVGEVFSYDPKYDRYRINGIPSEWETGDLEPYAEPEIKPTEDMETKELNLAELLKGHEGEVFYSPIVGACILKTITDYIYVAVNDHPSYCFFLDGRREKSGAVVFFPSRALYEQYPLDPYTAWMKWREEQKKHILQICYAPLIPDNIPLQAQQTEMADLNFRTPGDRDKCIEEIQSIIEKYSKK